MSSKCSASRSAANRKELPNPGNTFEFVVSSFLELGSRTSHQERDDCRREQLARLGVFEEASSDVNSDTSDVITAQFHFASVQSQPNGDVEQIQRVTEGEGPSDRTARAVEGGQGPITSQLDKSAAVLANNLASHLVVAL